MQKTPESPVNSQPFEEKRLIKDIRIVMHITIHIEKAIGEDDLFYMAGARGIEPRS